MASDPAAFDLDLHELERYRPIRNEPADFDDFWRSTLDIASAYELDFEMARIGPELTSLEAFDVSFRGYAGDVINGWLIRDPRVKEPRTCVVEFLGYSGGPGALLNRLTWASLGFVHLVVETRGQGGPANRGRTPDPHTSHPHIPGFLTKGIQSPESYFYRRVFADAVRALDVAACIPGVAPGRIVAAGRSQGGGIALAAGAMGHASAVIAEVPFRCHFERAIRVTDATPYSEISNYLQLYRGDVDLVRKTNSYFDAMDFAARGRCPALFTVGLMDRMCPPSTVFAAYNHYVGERQMQVWHFNGHEGGDGDQYPISLDSLAELFPAPSTSEGADE